MAAPMGEHVEFEEIINGDADSDFELECGSESEDEDGEEQGDQGRPFPGGGGDAGDTEWVMGGRLATPLEFTGAGQQGIVVDIDENPTPLTFLRLLLPEDFFSQLVEETNRY